MGWTDLSCTKGNSRLRIGLFLRPWPCRQKSVYYLNVPNKTFHCLTRPRLHASSHYNEVFCKWKLKFTSSNQSIWVWRPWRSEIVSGLNEKSFTSKNLYCWRPLVAWKIWTKNFSWMGGDIHDGYWPKRPCYEQQWSKLRYFDWKNIKVYPLTYGKNSRNKEKFPSRHTGTS